MSFPPSALIARTFFARGALLWAGTRALLSAVFLLGGVDPMRLTLGSIILVLAATIGVGAADILRRHEGLLLANLGVSRATAIAFFALPALFGEIVLGIVGAMRA